VPIPFDKLTFQHFVQQRGKRVSCYDQQSAIVGFPCHHTVVNPPFPRKATGGERREKHFRLRWPIRHIKQWHVQLATQHWQQRLLRYGPEPHQNAADAPTKLLLESQRFGDVGASNQTFGHQHLPQTGSGGHLGGLRKEGRGRLHSVSLPRGGWEENNRPKLETRRYCTRLRNQFSRSIRVISPRNRSPSSTIATCPRSKTGSSD